MKPEIVFKPLDSRYSEMTHLGVISACGISIDPYKKLKMGEEAVIKIQPDRAFTLYHLGMKPEKVVVENEKQLRVVMPENCLLVFKYNTEERNAQAFSTFD